MIHQTSQDKCLRREVLINGRARLKENCSSLGREISEGRLRRCIEMKLNGPLEWNTNALILCQDFRRQTLIHFDWRVTCRSLVYSVCWVPRFPHYVSAPNCPNCLYLHLHWRRLPRLRKVHFSQGLLSDVEDILAGVLHICQQSNFPELWLMEGLPVTRAGRTNALYWMSPPSPQIFYRSNIKRSV